jgi:hypothetical protein
VPSKDYSDERKAILAKTTRLKALRLAKEAEEQAASSLNLAPAKPKKPRAARKKLAHAPWPW